MLVVSPISQCDRFQIVVFGSTVDCDITRDISEYLQISFRKWLRLAYTELTFAR